MTYKYEQYITMYLDIHDEEDISLLNKVYLKAEAFDLVDDSLSQLFDKYKWVDFSENNEQANVFSDEIERIRIESLKIVFGLDGGDSE